MESLVESEPVGVVTRTLPVVAPDGPAIELSVGGTTLERAGTLLNVPLLAMVAGSGA